MLRLVCPQISCKKGAFRCSVRYAKHSGPTAGMSNKNGRRLQADESGAASHVALEHLVSKLLIEGRTGLALITMLKWPLVSTVIASPNFTTAAHRSRMVIAFQSRSIVSRGLSKTRALPGGTTAACYFTCAKTGSLTSCFATSQAPSMASARQWRSEARCSRWTGCRMAAAPTASPRARPPRCGTAAQRCCPAWSSATKSRYASGCVLLGLTLRSQRQHEAFLAAACGPDRQASVRQKAVCRLLMGMAVCRASTVVSYNTVSIKRRLPPRQVVEEDGTLSWSTVYLFPHFVETGAHAFLRVSTAANASVRFNCLLCVLMSPSLRLCGT